MKRLVVTRLVVGLAVAVLLTAVLAAPAPAQVRASVDIGIRLSGPPVLEVIPNIPVYWAPRAAANVFFFAGRYWVYVDAGWHVGPTWSGPWVIVQPTLVPAPILKVPVHYYRVPPGHWKKGHKGGPPPWAPAYGREWREEAHERDWREKEEHWHKGGGKGCPPGLAKQGRC